MFLDQMLNESIGGGGGGGGMKEVICRFSEYFFNSGDFGLELLYGTVS